jgi:hypothetical protein
MSNTYSPLSPAKAGAQIQPERLGMTRLLPRPNPPVLMGSIWAPAFAGESGFLCVGGQSK